MDPEIDRYTADCDVIITIIARQRATIERLEKRIAQLEGWVSSVAAAAM